MLRAGRAHMAVPAPGAVLVQVALFEGETETRRVELTHRTGEVFHGWIDGVEAGTRYGLRVDGPWNPATGLRFNPAKLLLDPWARALDRRFQLHETMFDAGQEPDRRDSASAMPKAVAQAEFTAAPRRARNAGPRVVYELHVRGFTRTHPGIPEAQRGTFAGLAHEASIRHLRSLGVTTIELMPAAAWIDERHLPPLGLTNYWGYNPVAFLAPDPRLAPGGMTEVRNAVAALQGAGFEVILDVVLNHTGEGDDGGPTLSLKGLGDLAWYRPGAGASRYANDSGCGNTLALDRPWSLRLAMDALRHWALAAGLDGFRLDLATTLGRTVGGFDADASLLQAMRQDPVLRDLWIVAEPWDIGLGGHRLGAFAPGWGEWNDRFRDGVRRFWRGDRNARGELATRLAGSSDVFGARARPASDSVNFVTAHDGFALADLVAFSERRNQANGEDNRDGSGDNCSWNHGVEGPTVDPDIQARRDADIRALLATLLFARGTPMLSMGDELGRSQSGNNNAYAQDNELSWIDWNRADAGLARFVGSLVEARLAHPSLHEAGLPNGSISAETGHPDIAWLRDDGQPMRQHDWQDADARCLIACLTEGSDRVVVAIHAGLEPIELALPKPSWGCRWRKEIDTAGNEGAAETQSLVLAPRSVQLWSEAPDEAPRSATAPPSGTNPADPRLVAQLARAAGITTAWHDLEGNRHEVPRETVLTLLAALQVPAATPGQAADSLDRLTRARALPSLATADPCVGLRLPVGRALRGRPVRLTIEGPVSRELRFAPGEPVDLPLLEAGAYELRAEGFPEQTCRLLVAQGSCFLPPDLAGGASRFGISAQVYALRNKGVDQGIGDFSSVEALAAAASRSGATYVGLSPVHALHPVDRQRVSPYQPSDRRFIESLLVDVTLLPGFETDSSVNAALAAQSAAFARAAEANSVDYPAVARAKRQVFEAAWRALPAYASILGAFERFRAERGADLESFAMFTALSERYGTTDLSAWPAPMRSRNASGAAGAAIELADRIGFHAFVQYLADVQLGNAARSGAQLYRDLAVGAAPDGAEVWGDPGSVIAGFSIGAPPDPLGPLGQVWGLPPPNPIELHRTGLGAFERLLAANMRHAAALRIDHVMGLRRLFVVPDGARGVDGCYIDMPFPHLLGHLAKASQAARCLVVGEDLGTVPEGMREVLAKHEILSYRVLWFERDGRSFRPPAQWPARAAACVSTHDLPTLRGWWEEADLDERAVLGLLAGGHLLTARTERAAERIALLEAIGWEAERHREPFGPELAARIHGHVASSPSAIMLAQAEDLAEERIAVNLPGTDRERPNWRRRLPLDVQGLFETPTARSILAALSARSGATPSPGPPPAIPRATPLP